MPKIAHLHFTFSEAQYASHLQRHIIPLKYEEYQPTGWLGLMINSLLYYEVQTDELMMKNLPKIIKAIERQTLGEDPEGELLPLLMNNYY